MKDVLVVTNPDMELPNVMPNGLPKRLDARRCVKQVTTAVLLKYRMLIFGGGLYMGRINGVAALTRRFQELRTRRFLSLRRG